MSRTILPELGEIDPGTTVSDLIEQAYEDFKFTYGDYDKAGSMEDAAYYAGRIDAMWELLWNHTNIKSPTTGLAKKTSSLIGDPSTYQVLENHMNEQTAVDIAEAILPETETVAAAVQTTPYFAIGVVLGASATAGAMYLVYRKRKANRATVVVADPTV